ncbi:MAG: hypothetical protein NT079_01880, partial [Candidatus Omnitrophica bacterium]|nr:hypothetical protein [Candidatus Omnitrophota bacterium]
EAIDNGAKVIMIDSAYVNELGIRELLDEIWYIDRNDAKGLQNFSARHEDAKMSPAMAKKALLKHEGLMPSRQQYLQMATRVLNNNGTMEELIEKFEVALKEIRVSSNTAVNEAVKFLENLGYTPEEIITRLYSFRLILEQKMDDAAESLVNKMINDNPSLSQDRAQLLTHIKTVADFVDPSNVVHDPQARDLVVRSAQSRAKTVVAHIKANPEVRYPFPTNPLKGTASLDIASGTAESIATASEDGEAIFVDRSFFMCEYLREVVRLFEKKNILILEQDARTLAKPATRIGLIREKNMHSYIRNFDVNLFKMTEWLEPHGQLIIEGDSEKEFRHITAEYLGDLMTNLIHKGWKLEFEQGVLEKKYDRLTLTKPQLGDAVQPAESFRAFQAFLLASSTQPVLNKEAGISSLPSSSNQANLQGKDNTGGIDFNSDKLNIEERGLKDQRGKGLQENQSQSKSATLNSTPTSSSSILPETINGIPFNDIQGFTPIIGNIIVITNFPDFVLGIESKAPVAPAHTVSEGKEVEKAGVAG